MKSEILLRLLIFLLILFSKHSYCQKLDFERKICLNKINTSPREVISELEKVSGFRFAFQSDLMDNYKPVTIKSCEYTIEEVIQIVFANENLELILTGKQVIVVKPKPTEQKKVLPSKPLIQKEIEEVESELTNKGELAIDSLSRKYPELVEIERISVTSLVTGNSIDSSIRTTQKNLIRVEYDTNTFIIYDTIRTKFYKIIKLGFYRIPSINTINNINPQISIISKSSSNALKAKTKLFRSGIRFRRTSSIIRKKNDHLDPYSEKQYGYTFLNANYLVGIETGINLPINYKTNNYQIPDSFQLSESKVSSSLYYGFKLILNEKGWEPMIGFRYLQISMNLTGNNYTIFTDSSNILNREEYYTYNVFPADTYYKYYPGRDTIWITVYDSTRITHEILTYGKDSIMHRGETRLLFHHFEIPLGVGYNIDITKHIGFKPSINFIFAYDKTILKSTSKLDGWETTLSEKVFTSLLTSFDLSVYYKFTKDLSLYASFYSCNSIYSFSEARNWNFYSSFGAGIGLTYKIRSKKK